MDQNDLPDPTARIAELARRVSAEPRLRAELQRARREFFGEAMAGHGSDVAEHRFAEWFLLERESETLGAVPSTVPPFDRESEGLGGSIVGLFLVESIGQTVLVKDVQDREILELEPGGAHAVGDLLVGRLYPRAGERWLPSAATPTLRPGRELADAFLRDVARLELGRRLHQIELEHLLLRHHEERAEPPVAGPPPAPIVPLEHLEADLERLLRNAGAPLDASAISQELREAPRPGTLIGPLLDRLAFDTDVDLDRARQLLLEIWNAHHEGDPAADDTDCATPGPPGESLGERLVRTLEEGLGQRRNVEDLFAELERMAGVDPEEEEEGDDGAAANMEGDGGELAALVAEYEWETERHDAEGPLRLWIELQRNAAVPTTDLTAIGRHDLMRLLLHVYLRSAPDERAARVRSAFADLERFYEWLAATQELDRRAVLGECRGALLEHLDRLQAAGRMLSNDEAPAQPPRLLQVEDTGRDGFGARDDDGEHHWCRIDPAAAAHLRVGDLLLAGFAGPRGDEPTSLERRLCGLVVVMPIDARALIE